VRINGICYGPIPCDHIIEFAKTVAIQLTDIFLTSPSRLD
jgi:hypothetical protein